MPTIRRVLTTVALITCVSSTASAQRLPTDTELHAAACIPVMHWAVGVETQALAEMRVPADAPKQEQDLAAKVRANLTQQLADSQSALARLQAYLLPRLTLLEPVAIAAAQSRGDADVRELTSLTARCASCVDQAAAKTPTKPDYSACEYCKHPVVQDRLFSCKNPTWLPF